MTEEPSGDLSVRRLLAHEDELFRLAVSIAPEKDEASSSLLPSGFAQVASAVFLNPLSEMRRVPWDFSIVLCGDSLIRDLNRKFRELDEPTDILSFEGGGEYSDSAGKSFFCAGELVISLDALSRNAAEFNVSENEELKRLVIHGILHLNGMDHSGSSLGQKMLKIQETILKTLDDVFVLK